MQSLATVYALIEAECPQVLPQMKRVMTAVEKYKIATQNQPVISKIKRNNSLQR